MSQSFSGCAHLQDRDNVKIQQPGVWGCVASLGALRSESKLLANRIQATSSASPLMPFAAPSAKHCAPTSI